MNLLNKKIGVALGGGASLGLAHIGFIKALQEFGVQPTMITGTSAGALVGSFWAYGKNWEEMAGIARSMNWFDVTKFTFSKMGLLSNQRLDDLIKKHIDNITFEELQTQLVVVCTDISTGDKVIINKGHVGDAVMASTCIPGIFIPVEIEDRLLVDGAIVENVPISPLINQGLDVIISVDVVTKKPHKKPTNVLEVLLNAARFSVTKKNYPDLKEEFISLNPDLHEFSVTSIDKSDQLIERGYLECKELLAKYLL